MNKLGVMISPVGCTTQIYGSPPAFMEATIGLLFLELKYDGSGGSTINRSKLDQCNQDDQYLWGPHNNRSNTSATLKHPRIRPSGLPHGPGKPSIEALDARHSPMLPHFHLLESRLAATPPRSTGEVRSQSIECLREPLTERSRFPGASRQYSAR